MISIKDQINNFRIPYDKEFSIFSIKNNYIIVFSTDLDKKYIKVPSYINIIVEDKILQFTYNQKDENLFNQFLSILNGCLKNFIRPYRKKLFLKGLGYRVSISDDKKDLVLKLGYSHVSSLPIPLDRLIIKVNKNFITVEGFDAAEVGNFASKIRRLRTPDIYKGKGVWYKNEIKILKELKKK